MDVALVEVTVVCDVVNVPVSVVTVVVVAVVVVVEDVGVVVGVVVAQSNVPGYSSAMSNMLFKRSTVALHELVRTRSFRDPRLQYKSPAASPSTCWSMLLTVETMLLHMPPLEMVASPREGVAPQTKFWFVWVTLPTPLSWQIRSAVPSPAT